MKKSLRCPKCQGERIWVIERFRVPDETDSGRQLSVVQNQETTKGFMGLPRVTPRGHFDLYACNGCGYSELYAEKLSELTADPKKGVRLIDATAKKQGPFR
jgi:predicted nucleic-acid-binding Zn-ribbon protein